MKATKCMKFLQAQLIPTSLPFVRTGWQEQSSCQENSTINQEYPARSLYSTMVCRSDGF